ncbi:MAG: hypothetical protein NTX45_26745 [Proteobacteria bacterium]|nr:hypothetical protein [Pseudomonadota bacterium]
MLQTIEVEIDAQGVIRPLEPMPVRGKMRGLLTILTGYGGEEQASKPEGGGGIESLFGIAKSGKSVSLEDMEAVIRQRGGEIW